MDKFLVFLDDHIDNYKSHITKIDEILVGFKGHPSNVSAPFREQRSKISSAVDLLNEIRNKYMELKK